MFALAAVVYPVPLLVSTTSTKALLLNIKFAKAFEVGWTRPVVVIVAVVLAITAVL